MADTSPPPRPKIGFHASHEQFSPRLLLDLVQAAEQAGFDAFFSSDHLHPWSEAQGQSGFSFAWVAAALQATRIPGRMICCPFGRYHPAIVAQAAATLEEMFPGRYGLAIGSGQALNEHVTGAPWPHKSDRQFKLKASAEIIRALWAGEVVTRSDPIVVDEAKVYSRPTHPPLLFGAAVTAETANWVATWADGLLTTHHGADESVEMVEGFRRNGGRADRLWVKVGLSYARSEDQALTQAHAQWRNGAFANTLLTELKTTAQFDEAGKRVRPEDMREVLRISSDLDQHIAWLRDDLKAGFTELFLHNVGLNQREFIEDFSRHVLPALR